MRRLDMKASAPPHLGGEAAGEVAAIVRPYGIGVDCHSRFIQVCVLVFSGGEVLRHEREFAVGWSELGDAKLWTAVQVHRYGVDVLDFGYVIESTGCYHFPVVLAWEGSPCVVNPMLAGPYRRKSDRLDARVLAYHGITGLWPPSFFPTGDVIEFRLLVLRRRQMIRERTRTGHFINNTILRWGTRSPRRGPLSPPRSVR